MNAPQFRLFCGFITKWNCSGRGQTVGGQTMSIFGGGSLSKSPGTAVLDQITTSFVCVDSKRFGPELLEIEHDQKRLTLSRTLTPSAIVWREKKRDF